MEIRPVTNRATPRTYTGDAFGQRSAGRADAGELRVSVQFDRADRATGEALTLSVSTAELLGLLEYAVACELQFDAGSHAGMPRPPPERVLEGMLERVRDRAGTDLDIAERVRRLNAGR